MLVVLFKLVAFNRVTRVELVDRHQVKSEAEGDEWAKRRAAEVAGAAAVLRRPPGAYFSMMMLAHLITRKKFVTDPELRGLARSWWERYGGR